MQGRIKVDPERRIGAVDRKLYGNFVEHLGRCIYGGIYQPGSPLADERGFRRDVAEAVRRLQVPILRWPGGNFVSGYHWLDGVGPRPERPRRMELAWHTIESNQFGTDEFVEYCRLVGAEPYICVNMGSGTMDEAAGWVEYCNGREDTHFAGLRRRYGHPEPYRVEYWGLGNEVYGQWQIGHKSAEDYAKAALEFAKVIKWTDPSAKLVACGAQRVDWDWEVLTRVGRHVEYISAHFYWGAQPGEDPYYSVAAGPFLAEEYLRVLAELVRGARRELKIEHPILIAVDEWNVWYRHRRPPLEERYDLADALVVATFLNILRRNCRTIGMANLAQLVNVIAPIFTSDEGLFYQTIYWPLFAAANYGGPVALDAWVESEGFDAPRLLARQAPYLDVCATLDEAAGRLYLSIVNLHRGEGAEIAVDVGSLRPTGAIEHLISGQAIDAANSFESPDDVRLVSREVSASGGRFVYTLPAHSAAVLELTLR